jgi:hypothetical protein
VNEAGDAGGETNLDGMLIKGRHRIDAELKLFATSALPILPFRKCVARLL